MSEFVEVLKLVSPSALPLVVVLLGGIYLWLKFGRMEKDRQVTKIQRDSDSQDIHDDILKLQFEMTSVKGIIDLHRETLTDLQKQMQIVVKELVELNCSIKLLLEERRGICDRKND